MIFFLNQVIKLLYFVIMLLFSDHHFIVTFITNIKNAHLILIVCLCIFIVFFFTYVIAYVNNAITVIIYTYRYLFVYIVSRLKVFYGMATAAK